MRAKCGAAGTAGGRDQPDDDDDDEEEEWLARQSGGEWLPFTFLLSGCIWSWENVSGMDVTPSPPLMVEPITAVLGWGRGYSLKRREWPNERVSEAVGRRCGSPLKTWKEFSRPGN